MPPPSRSDADPTADRRLRHQEIVTGLARRALESETFDQFLQEASETVVEVLGTEYASVLECRPSNDEAVLRRGVSWNDDDERATVSLEPGSRVGDAVRADAPVVEGQPAADQSERLNAHDVRSGLCVAIGDEPWGVLETYTDEAREYDNRDVAFLEDVADVLSSAAENAGATAPESAGPTQTARTDNESPPESASARRRTRVVHALETASDGVSLLDEDGELIYVNDAYADLYRYDPEEMRGMHWEELYPVGLADEIYEDVLPQVSDEGTWSGETIGLRSDGTQFIEDHSLTATEDGSLVCVVRDVTAQRRLEEELDVVYSRITDAFVGLDPDWTFTHVNDRAAELIGIDGEELVGRSLWTAFPDAESTLESKFRGSMTSQEPASFEEYVPTLDAWLEVNVYPSETGLSVYFRDVTERKAVDRELRENNRTLKRLYEITADRDDSFERKVKHLLELGRERLGLDVGFVASVDAKRDRFVVDYAIGNDDRLQAGATTSLSETYCRRTIESDGVLSLTDAGSEGWTNDPAYERWDFDAYVGCRIPVGDGRYRTICFADNSSRETFTPAERSFVELATQWLSYELERQHHQRELETLVRDLETSNERLEHFAYAASHDLQEPLRMVASYLTLIENRYGDRLDEDGEEFLAYAVDGAERMHEMIEGLLAYSRVETSGDPFEPVELDDVLADVRSDLQVQIEEHDATITAASLPRVTGDSNQLRQLFQNLLSNAIKYSGDEPPRVRIDADRSETDPTITVHDEGIGIDPTETDRIFEVFQRLHSHSEKSGAGIGLALCQRIVERHDGEIRVESEPDEGSTFAITLSTADVEE